MKKKIIGILAIILIIGAFVVTHLISYANDVKAPLYVRIEKRDTTGVGYGDGNPEPDAAGGAGEYIWNLTTYDSTNATEATDEQRDLYCVNADYGATWFTGKDTTKILEYKRFYNIQDQNDINNLKAILEDATDDGIEGLFKKDANGQYSVSAEFLWLLDNLYIPTTAENTPARVNEFLAKTGIIKKETDYLYKENNTYVCPSEIAPKEEEIAKDIIAVQRMAIWYFTDGINKTGEGQTAWLHTINPTETKYSSMAEDYEYRNIIAMHVYNYLITQAQENEDKYLGENKITVDTTNLATEAEKYILETRLVNKQYVTGPIKITSTNSDGTFDVKLSVTGATNYKFTDVNGTEIEGATLESLVRNNTEFYIATNTIKNLNIAVTVTPTTSTKTLWLAENEKTELAGEQPIVEITKGTPETTNFIVKPFDLALRKYITAVKSGDTVTTIDNRTPNYGELTALKNGTDSTATYNHRKDPVEVKDGDIVTYTLSIYNEGSIDGYATKIVDQLPEGLYWNNQSQSTVTSSKENTYSINYDMIDVTLSQKNQITLNLENKANILNAYDGGEQLDCETITLECIVATSKLTTQKELILTNVAWIEGACDADGKTVVDRDSQPEALTNVEQNNISDYKGSTQENDLSKSDYFYKGQQDDDDFEKLVIKKKFDLALVKFITAISKDQTIEDAEYLKDAYGRYSREPDVKIDPTTGKIIYDFTDRGAKEPLSVNPGDYVLYTIRVYNEGAIDGYVNKIKDTLPKGLEFVQPAPINIEYLWELAIDEDGKDVITTTAFAKGQGAEYGATEEDANYNANLLKAFKKEEALNLENPDYVDAKVLCQVVEPETSDRVLVNYAEISEDSDDDIDSTPNKWIENDDDQDIEKVKVKALDLSLRKFITSVDGVELKDNEQKYIREPKVDVAPLKSGEDTAIYVHPKQPVDVQTGEKVIYTIRVYNEGDLDGFASEITDYLPPYLKYIKESELNKNYGWQISDDGRIAKTTYLADEKFKLTAFDSKAENAQLDYEEVQIECIVAEDVPVNQNQTNIAEITEYKYSGKIVSTDRDSTSDNMINEKDATKNLLPSDENLPTYKNEKINDLYVAGNEDDDDFEKVYVKDFDLALRKFITEIKTGDKTKVIDSRIPQVNIEPLKNGEKTAKYDHPKEALGVHVDDVVIYTIRVYNEGEVSGYASEITDDIPEYLEYLPEDSTNINYLWKMYDENGNETEKVEDATSLKTDILSKEENLIKAFDGEKLDYKDVKIAFKIKDPNSNTYIITNHAQITEDKDENGNPVDDNDSDTEKWNDGEDDQDIENIKVQYFDLSLLKFVSKVIVVENGKEKISETGHNGYENPEPVVKVELHKKKLNNVVVKFVYGITVINEGDIAGYATELTDYVPEGLKFEPDENPEWTDEGNNVISTKQTEGILLQPGESTTVEVVLTWINGKDNMGLKTNTVEISEDKNDEDVPDKDSTPDNKVDGEDDIDIAKVMLNIMTGTVKTYFMLTIGLLAVVLVGIALIKRFVI